MTTGTNQIRAREEGKHVTRGTQDWQYSPLPNGASRTVHHPTGRGGGRSGGLKGHGDRTGQEASRAAPILGAMAERGGREAMADPGTPETMAGQGAREAMAEQGAREAMAGQGAREAMAGQGAREAMAGQGAREAMVEQGAREAMAGPPPRPRPQPPPRSLRLEPYYPPQKFPWGK